MIGYVTIGAKDSEASGKFYDAFFGAFGHERKFADGGWIGYGPKGSDSHSVYVCPPHQRPAGDVRQRFDARLPGKEPGRGEGSVQGRPRRRRQRRRRAGLSSAREAGILRCLSARSDRQQALRLLQALGLAGSSTPSGLRSARLRMRRAALISDSLIAPACAISWARAAAILWMRRIKPGCLLSR